MRAVSDLAEHREFDASGAVAEGVGQDRRADVPWSTRTVAPPESLQPHGAGVDRRELEDRPAHTHRSRLLERVRRPVSVYERPVSGLVNVSVDDVGVPEERLVLLRPCRRGRARCP